MTYNAVSNSHIITDPPDDGFFDELARLAYLF